MEKYKLIKRFIVWLIIGIISSLVAHFLIEFLYNHNNIEYVFHLIFSERTELFLLGAGVLFIFYLLFSSIFGSALMGSILLLFISGLIGIATQYKFDYRAEPLFPNELYMVKEIPFLLEMIGIERSILILGIIFLVIGSLVLLYKFIIKPRKEKENIKRNYLLRIIGAGTSIVLLIPVLNFNHPDNMVKEKFTAHASWVNYNQNMNYNQNGFIAGFLSNLPAPAMEQPADYSRDRVKEIVDKYSRYSEDLNRNREGADLGTNIIFVMNETFSDPFNLNEIESNKDPLPNFREIVTESISGNVMSPSIGGGTATNEFQALTGFSMEPFAPHITSPYIQLVSQMESYPSITRKFKEYNYRTTAIHPYSPSLYRRTDVYENLEFDKFIYEETMKNREKISVKHRYISDFAAYQEIFDVLEASNTPDFVHLVTMQNHGPYAVKYDQTNYEVIGTGNNVEANPYFTDLENSDISLRLLINKIDAFQEPILLIFWGDHLPGFYEKNITENNSFQAMHETPFIVYSNRHDLSDEVEVISPIYLGNYIFETLDLKMTPYESMLKVLQDNIPMLENGLYLETDSTDTVNRREELSLEAQDLLEEYTLVMYDVTTGQGYTHELGFYDY